MIKRSLSFHFQALTNYIQIKNILFDPLVNYQWCRKFITTMSIRVSSIRTLAQEEIAFSSGENKKKPGLIDLFLLQELEKYRREMKVSV